MVTPQLVACYCEAEPDLLLSQEDLHILRPKESGSCILTRRDLSIIERFHVVCRTTRVFSDQTGGPNQGKSFMSDFAKELVKAGCLRAFFVLELVLNILLLLGMLGLTWSQQHSLPSDKRKTARRGAE